MINLAILASGGGSNARAICTYFKGHPFINVALIISNKSEAGVHNVAAHFDIPSLTVSKRQFMDCPMIKEIFISYEVDFIILAGFLLMVPKCIIDSFPRRIINIHPSLLPKYGGAGMYGHHVHEAVKVNHEVESGMTIHLVNEKYDDGEILLQAKCPIIDTMTVDDIAAVVLTLEHKYYSPTIEKYILESKH